MRNSERIPVIYNEWAGNRDAFEKAARVRKITGGEIFNIRDLQEKRVKTIPYQAIIIGGDGTYRKATLAFRDLGVVPEIGIVKSGTGNISARTLESEGFKSSLEEFIQGSGKMAHYKLGIISFNGGNEEIFVIASGFGWVEKEWAKAMEKKARGMHIGKEAKLYVAGLEALKESIRKLKPGESMLETYCIGEQLGTIKMFDSSKLNVESPLIGLAQIKGENPVVAANKLALALVLKKAGVRNLPNSILSMRYSDVFETDNNTGNINIDGDTREVAVGQVKIQRTGNGAFPVTAIQL